MVSEEDIVCLEMYSDYFMLVEQVFLCFVELFVVDYMVIDDEYYVSLLEFFICEQVVEFNMYCVLMLVGGCMIYVQWVY